MSEFRRRLLINATKDASFPKGYITDGLAFQLDGINKGGEPLAWTDLIGGRKFIYNSCLLNKDNVEFDGKTSYCNYAKTIGVRDKDGTIEVVYQTDAVKGITALFFPRNYGEFGYLFTDSNNVILTAGVTFPKIANIPLIGQCIVSYTTKCAVKNKKKIPLGEKTQAVGIDEEFTYIGKRVTGNFFKGKIYAIRIYNRQLTEEEMIHNQQEDANRFFGGVVPN